MLEEPVEGSAAAPGDPAVSEADQAAHASQVESERQRRVDELIKQVRQVVKGSQFAETELAELVAGFRMALGLPAPAPLPRLDPADEERVRDVARALVRGRGGALVRYAKAELGDKFLRVLRDHVTGPLAPLISEIEVGWPSELLQQGVVLVDLPGVGVASDRYRKVTAEYIRQKARAVILLVDRAGPTDASVELIRESGYWDRLLLSSDDPDSDPCALVLAVSKIDDVAREEYRQHDHLPRDERPKLRELFVRLRDETAEKMRVQAVDCFSKLASATSEDEAVRAARVGAGKALLDSLAVFPVSATQYRDLLAEDEEAPPFLKRPEESGVPALVEHLTGLAAAHRRSLAQARQEVAARLLRTATATLDRIQATWSDETRAGEEAAKLRDELDRFLAPKRRELDNREGAFREFLETSYNTRIDDLVAKIQAAAQLEVARYLLDLRGLHWATLRATVTRGGAFVSGVGRRLDLPADVAQRFQEPTAAVWSQTLLRDIRARTKQHGQTIEQIVGEICDWGKAHAQTDAQRASLETHRQLAHDQSAQLGQVGRDAVDELKDAVKRELIEQIGPPIRKACEQFVARGDAYGPGVKNRMLELFAQLGQQAVAAAANPAMAILKRRFNEVRQEIVKALSTWGDPMQQTANAIVESEDARRSREDEMRRRQVLAELERLRGSLPANERKAA